MSPKFNRNYFLVEGSVLTSIAVIKRPHPPHVFWHFSVATSFGEKTVTHSNMAKSLVNTGRTTETPLWVNVQMSYWSLGRDKNTSKNPTVFSKGHK